MPVRRAAMVVLLFGWFGTLPASADDPSTVEAIAETTRPGGCPEWLSWIFAEKHPATDAASPARDDDGTIDENAWRTVWGLVGLHAIPAGPKTAPNGQEYHPNFSLDLDFNLWLWRSQGLYAFADARFWGEKPENGVTNARDGGFGTSKRQFDLSGGAAWNYYGFWEARAFGYSMSNLNRGISLLTPSGLNDGSGLENRYYLTEEYSYLGQTGFDVTRASFVSIGYYLSKNMVGNDGQVFEPGFMLRAYLICDLWEWPCYLYSDTQFICEKSSEPKLLLFDLGLAARPFHRCEQCEFRAGAESTADLQLKDMQTLWYVSIRYVF
jgi:hypothetical protein